MLFVRRFEVAGSHVFSPEEFAAVTAPFTGREISFAELLQARSAVTQLYISQGYVTSGAFIPPQTLEGGVVKIQVIEFAGFNPQQRNARQPFFVLTRTRTVGAFVIT